MLITVSTPDVTAAISPCMRSSNLHAALWDTQQGLRPSSTMLDIPGVYMTLTHVWDAAAFGLNMSVFLLIGKTSALTMNVAGVIKDWMLIALSVLLFHAEVTLMLRTISVWLPLTA